MMISCYHVLPTHSLSSYPVVFQEARSILQEIRKIQETEKIQSLWECLITIILSFSWMFTKRSIYFCIKTCAVPIKADWRRVPCDRANSSQKNDLSENQEYLKKRTNERKDNKLPQKYMWALLFPNYLLDIQHIQEQKSSAELQIMHLCPLAHKSFVAFYLCNSVGGRLDWMFLLS